ncbi:MAG: winged helix-turn-helix transcriptional regulator [Proteobacteria bacterium]|nr:winged helix-turn-helix transcriptional regulator [Pseudomonadota bacterium]
MRKSTQKSASRRSAEARTRSRANLNLQRYVPALLVFLANRFTTGTSALYLKNFGVGAIEWRCMGLIAAERWVSPNRICQVIGMDKAAVSRSLRSLEKKKLVEIRSSRQRSRFLEVALTESGSQLHGRLSKIALERERRLLAGIAPGDADLLISMLNHMLTNMPKVNGHIDMPAE